MLVKGVIGIEVRRYTNLYPFFLVKECVDHLSRDEDEEKLVASLWGAERCLRVLESVSMDNYLGKLFNLNYGCVCETAKYFHIPRISLFLFQIEMHSLSNQCCFITKLFIRTS